MRVQMSHAQERSGEKDELGIRSGEEEELEVRSTMGEGEVGFVDLGMGGGLLGIDCAGDFPATAPWLPAGFSWLAGT